MKTRSRPAQEPRSESLQLLRLPLPGTEWKGGLIPSGPRSRDLAPLRTRGVPTHSSLGGGSSLSRQELHLPTVPAAAGPQPCGGLLAPWLSLALQPGEPGRARAGRAVEEDWAQASRAIPRLPGHPQWAPLHLHRACPQGEGKLSHSKGGSKGLSKPFGVSERQGPWVPGKMDQPVETGFSDHPTGWDQDPDGEQVAGSELQFPARWSPGRFGASLVSPAGFEAVFQKWPTLVFS